MESWNIMKEDRELWLGGEEKRREEKRREEMRRDE
jgi:hypothetical protein